MSCCKKPTGCPTKTAFGRVVVDIQGGALTDPIITVNLSDCVGSCGIKLVDFVKVFSTLVADECVALKIKLVYEDCFYARGLAPLLLVSTAAPDEHTYDAEVRAISDISNGQCAYFRVGIHPAGQNTCYPQCGTSTLSTGQVVFDVYALQGNECK